MIPKHLLTLYISSTKLNFDHHTIRNPTPTSAQSSNISSFEYKIGPAQQWQSQSGHHENPANAPDWLMMRLSCKYLEVKRTINLLTVRASIGMTSMCISNPANSQLLCAFLFHICTFRWWTYAHRQIRAFTNCTIPDGLIENKNQFEIECI